jgi:transposase
MQCLHSFVLVNRLENRQYPSSKKPIVRWIGEIISYFEERITNGLVEGINNKLKLIKLSAYGLINFNSFRTRVLLS